MKILIDSREQDVAIPDYFDKNGIDYEIKKLSFGDFSFIYNNKSYEKEIVIERKKSFSEIIPNLTKKRSRFYREFHRARLSKAKLIIMIEQTEKDLWNHNYYSRTKPIDVYNILTTFCNKYLVDFYTIPPIESPKFILNVFKDEIEKIESN